MDAEKLINAVRSRRSLWYQKDTNYHNRDVNHLLWAEVANEMSSSIDRVRKKWKSLRDVFRSELKRFPKSKSADGTSGGTSSSWAYFSQMMFVKDQMTTRQLKKTLNNQTVEETPLTLDVIEGANYDVKFVTSEKHNTSGGIEPSDTGKRKLDARLGQKTRLVKRKVDYAINFANVKQQKQKVLQEDTPPVSDADYHFLMSFLPAMKEMETPIKMLFRLRMQELLYQCTVNSSTMLISNCGHSETPTEEVTAPLSSVAANGI